MTLWILCFPPLSSTFHIHGTHLVYLITPIALIVVFSPPSGTLGLELPGSLNLEAKGEASHLFCGSFSL